MLNIDGVKTGIFFKCLTLSLSLYTFILIGINDIKNLGEYFTILSIALIAGFFDFGSSVMFKTKISESFIKNKNTFKSQYIYLSLIFYFFASIIFLLTFISFCIFTLGDSTSYLLIFFIGLVYSANFFFLTIEISAESLNLTKDYYTYKIYFYFLALPFIYIFINTNNILLLLFIYPVLNIFSAIFFLIKHPFYKYLKKISLTRCKMLFKKNINFQIKLVAVWMMGYLSYQLILPFSYNFYGSETAGKIGYTLNLINSILTIGIAINNLLFPKLVYYFSQYGKNKLALTIYKQNLIVLFASLFFIFIFLNIWNLTIFYNIQAKMLNLDVVFILIFIAGVRIALQINSNYFRVQGVERHFKLSAFMTICMGAIYLFLNDNIYTLFLSQLMVIIIVISISLTMINIDCKNNLNI
jgi:hypothetical protein